MVLPIQSFGCRNFRSLAERSGEIRLRPLTLLVGPNSSGKSSYLRLLALLKQTIESRDQTSPLLLNGPWTQLGAWDDLIWRHDISRGLEVNLDISTSGSAFLADLGPRSPTRRGRASVSSLRLSVVFAYHKPAIFVSSLRFSTKDGTALAAVTRNDDGLYRLVDVPGGIQAEDSRKSARFDLKKFYQLGPPRPFPKPSEQDMENLMLMSYILPGEIEQAFSSFYYLGPLRSNPQRYYIMTGENLQDVGLSGERAIEVLQFGRGKPGKALGNVSSGVNRWLKTFGFSAGSKLRQISKNIYYLELTDPHSDVHVNLADVGFGVSQVLPIIVQSLCAPDDSLLLLEQPEIHLNGRVQADLADLFIEASAKKTLLVETHSSDLITRLRRRISEGKADASNVAVYYCEGTKDGTALQELPLTAGGQFVDWPRGFLASELDDAIAQVEALRTSDRQ